jgi:hypothetical protein
MKILEVRFHWGGTREEYETGARPERFKELAGLRWKIYGFDDEKSLATGIYLFEDAESLNNYLVPFRQATMPDGVSNVEYQAWDVQEGLSKITKAPI